MIQHLLADHTKQSQTGGTGDVTKFLLVASHGFGFFRVLSANTHHHDFRTE